MLFVFALILALAVAIPSAFVASRGRSVGSYGRVAYPQPVGFVAVWTWVAAGVLLIVVVCLAVGASVTVTSARARIYATRSKEATYQHRAEVVGDTLRSYLIEQYPTYEQGTIDRVLDAGPDLLLLRFPELRAADTFIKYANQYRSLQDAIYKQQTERADLRAQIAAVRDNNLVYPTNG